MSAAADTPSWWWMMVQPTPPRRSPAKRARSSSATRSISGRVPRCRPASSLRSRKGADFVVTFDADGQHRADDIAGLLKALAAARRRFRAGQPVPGRVDRSAAVAPGPAQGRHLVHPPHHGHACHRHPQRLARDDPPRREPNLRSARTGWRTPPSCSIRSPGAGLRYVEVPVTIEYSAYSLAKGQKLSDSLAILVDLSAQRLHR